LRRSLEAAKVGDTEKINGMKRLHEFAKGIERSYAPEADFKTVMETEEAISKSIGGRSVFDDIRERKQKRQPQPGLFDGPSG
jgi:hypothetical protein